MNSLSKQVLNNTIVHMRQSVRQSKVHTVNKLVKEIQKLKNKKGTDEQKTKNTNKAERLVQIIQIIKKLNPDEVSKFALLNEKSMIDITNNVNEPLETKAIARLSTHRPIYEKVKNFREQFPEWKESIPVLLETLGEKHRTKKNVKKVNTKTDVSKVKTDIKWKTKSNASKNEVTFVHSKSGTWAVEDITVNKELSISAEVQSETTKLPKKTDKSNGNEIQVNEKNIKPKVQRKEAHPKVEKKVHKDDTAEDLATTTRQVDSFFVTKDNKEYLSVSVPQEDTKESSEVKSGWGSKIDRKNFEKKSFSLKTNERGNRFKQSDRNDRKFKQSDYGAPRREESGENAVLHPSWEAKRKQTNIAQFQGKKIKFGDE